MDRKVLKYKEIGINPKLRRDYNNLKTAKLDRACETLKKLIDNPFNVNYYEMKLQLSK